MRFSVTSVLATIVLSTACSPSSQTTSRAPATQPARPDADPHLASAVGSSRLPRVLLIGDSISMGYTPPVCELLKGRADVHRPPENCGPTTRGVERLDAWLGQDSWNVIHFNFGLHDIKYIDGKQQVSLEDYRKNLRTIVQRLKKTGARLIWCSTTPVPATSSPPRHNEDVLAYNAAAREIMAENGIPINDLYAFCLPRIEGLQRPRNVHFHEQGSKVLAERVAACILEALNGAAPPK